MIKFRMMRLTAKEFELLEKARNRFVINGLSADRITGIFEETNTKDLNSYLKSVGRKSLTNGALLGIAVISLLYLLKKQERKDEK